MNWYRLHQLQGDKKGLLAMDLVGAFRLIIKPIEDFDFNHLEIVTSIEIYNIENYHK